MAGFYLSNAAEKDMLDIAYYTEQSWGLKQSNTYLSDLDAAFHIIARYPGIGMSCDLIKKGYRRYPKGKHMIFYYITYDEEVEIIRILHQQMDFTKHV